MKEYVVTLKNFDDLDAFYDDMETPGGSLYIPNRVVECVNRREISRNTHYMLTDEEAVQIRNDPRVLSCELTPSQLGIVVRPHWIQTSSSWDKTSLTSNTNRNWGLLRCIEGVQRSNWGDDGITTQTATIQANAEGRNVDIVIVDGMINPNHPEMTVNSDGTGGSRVIQYNWLQYSSPPGTYQYTPYTGNGADADNNHGMHVAGTAAGNTQGWARSANIYNINPYGTDPNALDELLLFDYIRNWHNNKPVNPTTGRRNPTICNNSWGYTYGIPIADISSVNYRGTTYNNGLNSSTLQNSYGIINDGTYAYVPARYSAIEADVQDAINDGILMVGASGNDSYKIDVLGGQDYENYFVWNYYGSFYAIYYHQGMAPNVGSEAICVGAIGRSKNESKATFSNCGPRVDIYAPGRSVISSTHNVGVNDARGSGFLIKYSGTSMATPQVTGVLACLLEIYPDLTQAQAKDYLTKISKQGQISDSNGGYGDLNSLQGSPNRYLYYYKERLDNGAVWPKKNYKPRPATGQVYPRTRTRRK